jgi:hypothetical protein
VIEDRGDIYGDGVNVAARLESLAEAGGICISEPVRTAAGRRLALEDTRKALPHFQRAIEKDPGYGRAYAYAFWCYRSEVQRKGLVLSEEERSAAIRLMETGLKLDKDDPVVLWQAG